MGRRISRYYHTLRHLQLRQIAYQIYYRLSGTLQVSGDGAQVPCKEVRAVFSGTQSEEWAGYSQRMPERLTGRASFRFLNQSRNFDRLDLIDWNYNKFGKLWTYNLNYFEFLRQPKLTDEHGAELIQHWIQNESSHLDGWEPYPTSLRLVNWIQFYRSRQIDPPLQVVQSLHRQYQNLWSKREFHLGGNHLLENALALALGARYLDDLTRIARADDLLHAELKEQFLKDGAHYERSPMYHFILLWRMLDLYSLLIDIPDNGLRTILQEKIVHALGWANYIVDEQKYYPHFNDSTSGIAPTPRNVLSFAKALNLFPDKDSSAFHDSGYYHWRLAQADVWIDAAPVGPDYIPGHAHADTFNFCLNIGGKPIIVDTSISTYEKNGIRHSERSTRAHNTVSIQERDSSDVWGGFRVGKRANVILKKHEENLQLVAIHDGYDDLGIRCERAFYVNDQSLRIEDHLSRPGQAVARLHFDAGLSPELNESTLTIGSIIINLDFASSVKLNTYPLAQGFNLRTEAICCEIFFEQKLITHISWL